MSLDNPTIVQATSNTVTVVLNPSLNQVVAVQPQTGSTVVRDSVIRGPEGPQGPSGPAANEAYQQANTARDTANDAYTQANVARTTANNAYLTANNAYNESNAVLVIAGDAYDTANLKLNIAGGTVTGSLNVNQDLHVTGDISLNGNLIIGNVNTDTISVVADFTSNLIPDVPDTFNLGDQNKRWNEIHVKTANVSSINLSGNLDASQHTTITVGATTVNTSYISANVLISGPTETTYNVFTTNADVPITIDSFPSPKFTTVKYIIQSKTVDVYHSTELFCMQDGITAYLTEYATLINNYTLGTYSLTVSGGICNLIFHPNNPMNNIITVKLVRTAITA